MMIERVGMFRAYCDECGRPLCTVSAHRSKVEFEARASGWHVDGWRTVCPQCHREVRE